MLINKIYDCLKNFAKIVNQNDTQHVIIKRVKLNLVCEGAILI